MPIKNTFSIHTLGCKLNFSESSDIARQLTASGFTQNDSPAYIIINSCAVTATAEKKGRNLCAKLHREHPDAQIIIIGCYAALRANDIAQWPGVVATFGNEDKMNVVRFIRGEELPDAPTFFSSHSTHDRTRSFLKIQDGCDYHCSYCTVWKARGVSRSDSIAHVLDEIHEIMDEGAKEINITGVNIGDFGRKNGSSFTELVNAIEHENFPVRFRISSIEPNLLTDEIIQIVADSSCFMPHFHIPLQSGCNKILEKMLRRYRRELFAEKVRKIKEKIPEACIALDVIAGFPGETGEDFNDTYQFINSLPISYLHVFTYSKRPGTPAAEMKEQVSPPEKKRRTLALIDLSQKKKQAFYQQHLGETRPTLWEAESKEGLMFGFTDNYLKVKRLYDPSLVNTITPFTITDENIVID